MHICTGQVWLKSILSDQECNCFFLTFLLCILIQTQIYSLSVPWAHRYYAPSFLEIRANQKALIMCTCVADCLDRQHRQAVVFVQVR